MGETGAFMFHLLSPPLSPTSTHLHPPLRSGSRTDACDIDFERGRDQSGRGERGQEKEEEGGGWGRGGLGGSSTCWQSANLISEICSMKINSGFLRDADRRKGFLRSSYEPVHVISSANINAALG